MSAARICIGIIFTALISVPIDGSAVAACLKKRMSAVKFEQLGYDHDRWQTLPYDIERQFDGFVVSFDSGDDDDGDGSADALGVPHFVAHEIRAWPNESDSCIETGPRPQRWCSDPSLSRKRIAPTHESYSTSQSWRNGHPNWYERGHLAMKFLVERVGKDAAWNSHTVLNAVPQRAEFNQGIWKDLEIMTGRWAQEYQKIWVISGPIFPNAAATGWISRGRSKPVAVPDALFKIVIRENLADIDRPHVLAFIYPQTGPGFQRQGGHHYNHLRYLATVDEIEQLTSLDFLTLLPDEIERVAESELPTELWPAGIDIKACRKLARSRTEDR